MILVGAALLLIVVVMDFGLIVSELGYQVARIGSAVTGSEQVILSEQPQTDVPLGPDELRIRVIDVRAPIVYIGDTEEATFIDALHHGVVHYPETALPGEPGNVFIFGHSSDWIGVDDPYRNVFALLPHLAVGDEIEITDAAGEVFVYIVTKTFIVSPTDLRVLDQGDGNQSLLTLQTSYPFGTALARYIVRAELEKP